MKEIIFFSFFLSKKILQDGFKVGVGTVYFSMSFIEIESNQKNLGL